VEFAVILPLLVLMLVGTIDLARVFYEGITVANAARHGAQFGSLSPTQSADILGMEATALQDAINIEGVSCTAEQFCECPNGSPVDCGGDCGGAQKRIFVRVLMEKTFNMVIPFPGLPQTVVLSREAIMRAQ